MNAPEAIAELNRRIDALTPDEDHELYRVGFLDDGDESKGASAGAVRDPKSERSDQKLYRVTLPGRFGEMGRSGAFSGWLR